MTAPDEPGTSEEPADEPTTAELRRAIREDRARNQERHGNTCRCWLCRGN